MNDATRKGASKAKAKTATTSKKVSKVSKNTGRNATKPKITGKKVSKSKVLPPVDLKAIEAKANAKVQVVVPAPPPMADKAKAEKPLPPSPADLMALAAERSRAKVEAALGAKKMGRPVEYREEMCAIVMALGHEGKSFTQTAVILGINRDTLYEWQKTYPDFSDALSRARQASQAWWEEQGQYGLTTLGFQANLWTKNMACRFPDDWREVSRVERSGVDGAPEQHELVVRAAEENRAKQAILKATQKFAAKVKQAASVQAK